jgi:hypothetical protein
MKRPIILMVMVCTILLALGCTPKVGLVALDTRPPGASVYVDQRIVGETPVTFVFNMEKPATLKIEKDGYYPKTESLTVSWVKSEYHKGNFVEGTYMIDGNSQKAWEVRTVRDLIRVE